MFVTSRPRPSSRRSSTPIILGTPAPSASSSTPIISPHKAASSANDPGLTDGNGAETTPGGSNVAGGRRILYYAVREGHRVGVFDNWDDAEASIKDYDFPEWKTFKTQLAAEAFIAGGSGSPSFSVTRNPHRSSMPAPYKVRYGTPAASNPTSKTSSSSAAARHQLPLHERLERHFPPSIPASSSTSLRVKPGHRAKSPSMAGLAPSPLISPGAAGGPSDPFSKEGSAVTTDFGPLKPPRPAFARSGSGSSSGSSPVRRSSPLRQEVTDDEEDDDDDANATDTGSLETDDSAEPSDLVKRRTPTISLRGLMTPPISPVEPSASGNGGRRSRIEQLDRAGTGRSLFPASPLTLSEVGKKVRPQSVQPTLKRMESDSSIGSVGSESSAKSRKATPVAGLWGDITPSSPLATSPISHAPMLSPPFSPERGDGQAEPVNVLELDPSLSAANAPKFSRSALKRADVLMPLSPKQLSPVRSPTRSPTMSKSPSLLSLLKTSRRATAPTGSLDGLHEKLENLAMAPGASRGQENVCQSPPPMSRATSGLSISSMGSDRTFSSFATAKKSSGDVQYLTNVIDLADTPLETAVPQPRDRAETPISSLYLNPSEAGDEPLEPVKSIPSTSDATSIQTSTATHTQSENCADAGKGSKYGRRTAPKMEKSGGLGKKIMKVFGFGSGSSSPVGKSDESVRRFSG